MSKDDKKWVRSFETLDNDDVARVGGKNASLGEMYQRLSSKGVRVPDGFATTAEAYRQFLSDNEMENKIREALDAMHDDEQSLEETGKAIRRLFGKGGFSDEVREAIVSAYDALCEANDREEIDVAVRSSATAEDLPEASFAGQQETYLNVTGHDELIEACRNCYASLFTDRAISYREEQDFDHMDVALSVGVQRMVRSDKACSGVMFSLDTETGFPDVVVINGAWGLGETVVQGSVNPDEFMVYKPLLKDDKEPIVQKQKGAKEKKMVYASGDSKTTKTTETSEKEQGAFTLSDEEILQLARWAVEIEEHYDKPMDMEWGKDGEDDELYILQARPETVQSQKGKESLRTYSLNEESDVLLTGQSIGQAIASGKVQIIDDPDEIDRFNEGSILVTGRTDPDWVPIMKKAAGIITEYGGRTSHAAIVSRELQLPAAVGVSGATSKLEDEQAVTLSCAEGDKAKIYEGELDFDSEELDLEDIPETKTEIMMNLASPAAALRWWRLPAKGVGLARMEFIINNMVQVHPLALARFDEVEDEDVRGQIEELTAEYEDKSQYFVERLALGISKIACAQYPDPVIVRMSDFKTNEYADLVGGEQFEPHEENPMLGFRGASRYYSEEYRDGFALECRAMRRAREKVGLDNIIMMIPFCRTVEEADRVLETLDENEIRRGEKGMEIYVMAEIPSNIILASEFAERFDGFSIGTNDLTQLILGVDRDSTQLSDLFDERNDAIKDAISRLIETAHEADTKVGICGQAPSDHMDFAEFLVESGIDSMSLNPDSVLPVLRRIAEIEKA